MRFVAFCVLLLTISEPLLVLAEKVLLVIPQQTRRSSGPPWRSVVPRYRKSSHGNEAHYHNYHAPPFHYHKRPVHGSAPFPHGGDDFDHGYEEVNHVLLPHGKGISHAVSFGKGYVPYDKVKHAISFNPVRHSGTQEYKQSEPDYESSSFSLSSVGYPSSGHSYESHPQSETFFTDSDSSYNERRNDDNKLYSSRSIEKDLAANNAVDWNGVTDKGGLVSLQQQATNPYTNDPSPLQGGVALPNGIPSPTIGGSKDGIVLRDTVAMDHYQQTLQQMTKSWPQFFRNPSSNVGNGYQSQSVTASYTVAAPSTQNFNGYIGWPVNLAQPKQGYDVKEDNMEPPHDFRTAPVQTTPYQTLPIPVNLALPSPLQPVHG